MSPECDEAEQDRIDIIITLAEKIANAQHFIKSEILQVHIVRIQYLRHAIGTLYSRNGQQIFEKLPGIVQQFFILEQTLAMKNPGIIAPINLQKYISIQAGHQRFESKAEGYFSKRQRNFFFSQYTV